MNEEGHMEPAVFLVALITVVGTAAFTIVKVARLWVTRSQSPSADITARLEALERGVQDLQQEQAETQERLDFAERLLSKAREERHIGS
jgi:peptidoglycan hydrolase CwlO-like protein